MLQRVNTDKKENEEYSLNPLAERLKYVLIKLILAIPFSCRSNAQTELAEQLDRNQIAALLRFWRVPLNIEVTIHTDMPVMPLYNKIEELSRLVQVKDMEYRSICHTWYSANPSTVAFFLPANYTSFRIFLKNIAKLYGRSSTGGILKIFVIQSGLACHQLESDPSGKHIPFNSNFYVVKSPIKILEIYSVKGHPICQSAGNHYFDNIVSWLARRSDFRNMPIVATAVVDKLRELEAHFVEVNGKIVDASGLAVKIFKDLEFSLRFRGSYVYGDWIINSVESLPSGVTVEQLRNKSADIYITQTTLSPYRAAGGFSYLQPTFQDELFAFLQQPPSHSVHDVHISPFRPDLWMTLFGTWLLQANFMYWFSWIPLQQRAKGRPDSNYWPSNEKFQESVLWSIGAACNQGWHSFPTTNPCRLVVFFSSFSGLLTYITYSGSIISALTTETPPVQSFTEILKSSLDIYADQRSSTIQRIVELLEKDYPRAQGIQKSDEAASFMQIIKKPAALFSFSRNFYRTARNKNISDSVLCSRITKFPILKLPLQNGMMVTHWSHYREIFNYKIISLKQVGLTRRYMIHFNWGTNIFCTSKEIFYRENLGIHDVFTAFAILLCGSSASVLFFVIERLNHR